MSRYTQRTLWVFLAAMLWGRIFVGISTVVLDHFGQKAWPALVVLIVAIGVFNGWIIHRLFPIDRDT